MNPVHYIRRPAGKGWINCQNPPEDFVRDYWKYTRTDILVNWLKLGGILQFCSTPGTVRLIHSSCQYCPEVQK